MERWPTKMSYDGNVDTKDYPRILVGFLELAETRPQHSQKPRRSELEVDFIFKQRDVRDWKGGIAQFVVHRLCANQDVHTGCIQRELV